MPKPKPKNWKAKNRFRRAGNPLAWLVRLILRVLYSINPRKWLLRNPSQTGFVIPTAVMLLLVLSLIVGSMLIRTTQRTEQVIGQRNNLLLYNAATPAIERAKSKIALLFANPPSSAPSESTLETMMFDPSLYDLPDEERLELPRDNTGTNFAVDTSNAWSFQLDRNGDGTPETTIAYSILMRRNGQQNPVVNVEDYTDEEKAYNQVNRSGPLNIADNSNNLTTNNGCGNGLLPAQQEIGWYENENNSGVLSKNFQVNVIVADDDPNSIGSPNITTLEYHQDREVDRGNIWAAWFRYDMEIYPGPQFNLNGAMHSQSSIMAPANGANSRFESYLISSPASCIYSPRSSQITLTEQRNQNNGNLLFQGQWISGQPVNGEFNDGSNVHKILPATELATLTNFNDVVTRIHATAPSTNPASQGNQGDSVNPL